MFEYKDLIDAAYQERLREFRNQSDSIRQLFESGLGKSAVEFRVAREGLKDLRFTRDLARWARDDKSRIQEINRETKKLKEQFKSAQYELQQLSRDQQRQLGIKPEEIATGLDRAVVMFNQEKSKWNELKSKSVILSKLSDSAEWMRSGFVTAIRGAFGLLSFGASIGGMVDLIYQAYVRIKDLGKLGFQLDQQFGYFRDTQSKSAKEFDHYWNNKIQPLEIYVERYKSTYEEFVEVHDAIRQLGVRLEPKDIKQFTNMSYRLMRFGIRPQQTADIAGEYIRKYKMSGDDLENSLVSLKKQSQLLGESFQSHIDSVKSVSSELNTLNQNLTDIGKFLIQIQQSDLLEGTGLFRSRQKIKELALFNYRFKHAAGLSRNPNMLYFVLSKSDRYRRLSPQDAISKYHAELLSNPQQAEAAFEQGASRAYKSLFNNNINTFQIELFFNRMLEMNLSQEVITLLYISMSRKPKSERIVSDIFDSTDPIVRQAKVSTEEKNAGYSEKNKFYMDQIINEIELAKTKLILAAMGKKLTDDEKKSITKDLGISLEMVESIIAGQVPVLEETAKKKMQAVKDTLKNMVSPEHSEISKLKTQIETRARGSEAAGAAAKGLMPGNLGEAIDNPEKLGLALPLILGAGATLTGALISFSSTIAEALILTIIQSKQLAQLRSARFSPVDRKVSRAFRPRGLAAIRHWTRLRKLQFDRFRKTLTRPIHLGSEFRQWKQNFVTNRRLRSEARQTAKQSKRIMQGLRQASNAVKLKRILTTPVTARSIGLGTIKGLRGIWAATRAWRAGAAAFAAAPSTGISVLTFIGTEIAIQVALNYAEGEISKRFDRPKELVSLYGKAHDEESKRIDAVGEHFDNIIADLVRVRGDRVNIIDQKSIWHYELAKRLATITQLLSSRFRFKLKYAIDQVKNPGRYISASGEYIGSGIAGLMSGEDMNKITAFITGNLGVTTSPFGYRIHPIFGVSRLHAGQDIGAAHGTPLRSPLPGKVISADWFGGYGKAVVTKHFNYTILYGHLSEINVSVGQPVNQGTVVGKLGSTGYSTGPHLHLEVCRDGTPIDPRIGFKELFKLYDPQRIRLTRDSIKYDTSNPKQKTSGGSLYFGEDYAGNAKLSEAWKQTIRQASGAPAEQYIQLMEQYGAQFNIDPDIMAGLMLKESSMQQGLTSDAGAYGLTQFMPGTMQNVSSQLYNRGILKNRVTWQDFKSRADLQILFANYYLSQNLQAVQDMANRRGLTLSNQDKLMFALGIYNGGPKFVRRVFDKAKRQKITALKFSDIKEKGLLSPSKDKDAWINQTWDYSNKIIKFIGDRTNKSDFDPSTAPVKSDASKKQSAVPKTINIVDVNSQQFDDFIAGVPGNRVQSEINRQIYEQTGVIV